VVVLVVLGLVLVVLGVFFLAPVAAVACHCFYQDHQNQPQDHQNHHPNSFFDSYLNVFCEFVRSVKSPSSWVVYKQFPGIRGELQGGVLDSFDLFFG